MNTYSADTNYCYCLVNPSNGRKRPKCLPPQFFHQATSRSPSLSTLPRGSRHPER